ncbi:MAG: hypothetical protein ACKO2L_11645, partial [Planctomycetaceae bacterium]
GPTHLAGTKAVGTVPATGSACNACDQPSGSVDSDGRPIPPTPPAPKLRGQSPQPGRLVTPVTSLRVLSILTGDPVPPTSPVPKLWGQSPQPGRLATPVTSLRVLSILTDNPFSPTLPPPKLRGSPGRRTGQT